jgi:hypothetical protein
MVESGPNPYEAPAPVGDAEAAAGMAPLLEGQLSLTAFGLKLIYWGILILLISWIAMIPFGFVVSTSNPSMNSGQIIQWAFIGLTLTGFAFVNLGPFLCLSAPAGHGLRPLAFATVLAILLVWLSVMLESMVNGVPWLFFGGSSVLLVLAFTFFLAFLHRLTHVIQRDDLRRRCRIVFFLGVAVVLFILGQIFLARMATSANPLWLILGVVVFLSALVLFVGYANLVNAIANAIRHPERSRAGGIL